MSTALRLTDLPSELIVLICDQLWTHDSPDIDPTSTFSEQQLQISRLRLTCRALNEKTHDIFAKAAFETLNVQFSSKGLDRLQGISQSPDLADKVRRIDFTQNENGIHVGDEPYGLSEDRLAEERLRREQASAAYGQRIYNQESGTVTIALIAAVARLSRLQAVVFACRQRTQLIDPSTILFMAIGFLPYAKLKLQELSFTCDMWARHSGGYSVHAGLSSYSLRIPPEVLASSFSEIRVLELTFARHFVDRHDCNRIPTWRKGLSIFLTACPKLAELRLAFSNNRRIGAILHDIAQNVLIPNLVRLDLGFLRCNGADVVLFLENHKQLRSLHFRSLHILDDVTFRQILESVQEHQSKLSKFECREISQGIPTHMRQGEPPSARYMTLEVFFATCGVSGCLEDDEELGLDGKPPDVLRGFVYVFYDRYHAIAEAWEGVHHKIGILIADLRTRQIQSYPVWLLGGDR